MNAIEIAQAKTDEATRNREQRQVATVAAQKSEQRIRPIIAAWDQIWTSHPDRRFAEYCHYDWLKWATLTANRILAFVEAVDAAGYSDRLPFMTQISDNEDEHSLFWLYILVAKQSGLDAIHRLILYSIPEEHEPIDPHWWPTINRDFPRGIFLSKLTVTDLTCPSCGDTRTAHAAMNDRVCDACRSSGGTMAQLADAWDMLELYEQNTPALHASGVHDTILAAAAVVLDECKKTPPLLQLHKTTARRAIALLANRLNISVNDAFMYPIMQAKSVFESWNPDSLQSGSSHVEQPSNQSEQATSEPGSMSPLNLTPLEEQILQALALRAPQTQTQLARSAAGKDDASGHHKQACSHLVELGLILPGRPGRGSKGYTLTDKGRAYLASKQQS